MIENEVHAVAGRGCRWGRPSKSPAGGNRGMRGNRGDCGNEELRLLLV